MKITPLLFLGLTALLPAWAGPHPATAQPPLNLGDRRQVFIDGRLLAVAAGVGLREHMPAKTGEVNLRPDHPTHTIIGTYATVLYWQGAYHMWYDAFTSIGGSFSANGLDDEKQAFPAHRYLCYARSPDGINWTKPHLNLARAEPHVEPNIVVGLGAGGYPGNIGDAGSVDIDPHAGGPEELLLVLRRKEPGIDQLDLHVSADGINWRKAYERAMGYTDNKHHLDSQDVVFWDDRIGRYVAYARRGVPKTPGDARVRTVARAETENLARFPDVDKSPVVFQWDGLDPEHVDPVTGLRTSKIDYYTNATVKYPWAQDAYYMFPAAYYHFDAYQPEFADEHPTNAGVLDVRFAASRDGIRWHRHSREAFVRLGLKDAWDSRAIYLARGIVPGANPDQLFLYYRGSDQPHGWDRNPRNVRIMRAVGLDSANNASGISRLTIRRDGLISAHAGYAGGTFTTPVVTFSGDELHLNVDTSAGGEMHVEIQDELGVPVPGFSLADCDMIHSTNETGRVVSWGGKREVSALAGKPVRLHVVMRDTDLYAFQFVSRARH